MYKYRTNSPVNFQLLQNSVKIAEFRSRENFAPWFKIPRSAEKLWALDIIWNKAKQLAANKAGRHQRVDQYIH